MTCELLHRSAKSGVLVACAPCARRRSPLPSAAPANTFGSIFATAMLDHGTAQLGAQLQGGWYGAAIMALCWPVTPSEVKFAVDSVLEEGGFELSVPGGK